ncbi:glycosyl transferase 2 family protein [Synechococcus sp. NOUM97013]|nr:glycosyl transferase 2 family protein [Synechococcus sp. NOUM97013]
MCFEVIFVDYHSFDETLSIIYSHPSNYQKIVLSIDEPGIYNAINFGISHACAEWILILGSDDSLYCAHTVSSIVQYLMVLDYRTSLIYGTVFLMQDRKRLNQFFSPNDHFTTSLCQQSIVYRKQAIIDTGWFDTQYKSTADYVLNLKIIEHFSFSSLEFVDLIIANYNQSGFSSRYTDKMYLKSSMFIRLKSLGLLVKTSLLIRSFFSRNSVLAKILGFQLTSAYKLSCLYLEIIVKRIFLTKPTPNLTNLQSKPLIK